VELNVYIEEIVFFSEGLGRIRVFSIKVALATMCAGKLMDKLRCELVFIIFCLKYSSNICGKSMDPCSLAREGLRDPGLSLRVQETHIV
jgi:hypothetical protein